MVGTDWSNAETWQRLVAAICATGVKVHHIAYYMSCFRLSSHRSTSPRQPGITVLRTTHSRIACAKSKEKLLS